MRLSVEKAAPGAYGSNGIVRVSDSIERPMNAPVGLAGLVEFVCELQQRATVDTQIVLSQLVEHAAQLAPGAQYAALTAIDKPGLHTAAATGTYPVVLDDIQRQQSEGPGLTAAWENRRIRVNDLAADGRWPRYRSHALEQTPIRSIMSFRLFADHRSASALNFYAEQAHAFDDESVETASVVATYIALAWRALRHHEQFHSALATRDIIGQAKGTLMERFHLDAVEAFDLLARLSQQTNTKLVHVAQRLIDAEHPSPRRRASGIKDSVQDHHSRRPR